MLAAWLTVSFVLLFLAIGTVIASAVGKCPLWIPVFLVILLLLIERLPRD